MEQTTLTTTQKMQDILIRHRKKIIAVAIAVVLLAALVRFFTSYNIIFISVDSVPQNIEASSVKIAGGNGRTFEDIGGEGLKILPTDTTMISVTAGETIAQQTPVIMPWYRVAGVSANLQYSKQASATSFLSTTGSSCAVYNSDIDQLTGYPCLDASRLLHQEKVGESWRAVSTDTFPYISGAGQPYGDGVIGALYSEEYRASVGVKAVGSDGVIYKLPEEITYDDLRANTIVTDLEHPGNSTFAVIAQSGDVYVATPDQPDKLVSYKKYSAPKDYDAKKQQTTCTINGEVVHCYRGARLVGDQTLNSSPNVASTISKLSATAQKEETYKIDEPMADAIFSTSDGVVYLQKYTDLFKATEKGGKYKLQKIAQQVQSVTAGDELHYVSNQGVFHFDPESNKANQVFLSPNIKPIRTYSVADKTFVFATTGESRQTVYAYEVINKEYGESSKRIIDIFPAPEDKLAGVTSQRLVGDTLYVSFAAPISKTTQPTDETIDIVEQRRGAVADAIANLQQNLGDTLEIKYSY